MMTKSQHKQKLEGAWNVIGRLCFWLLWPAWFVYFRVTPARARVVLRHKDEILLVRGWLSSGSWELPGGGAHRGEPIAQAAGREIHEELGIALTGQQFEPLGELIINRSGLRVAGVLLLVDVPQRPALELRKFEISATAWVPATKIPEYSDDPFVLAALQRLK